MTTPKKIYTNPFTGQSIVTEDMLANHLSGKHSQKSHGKGGGGGNLKERVKQRAKEVIETMDKAFSDVAPINSTLEHARTAALASGVGIISPSVIKATYVAATLGDMMSGTELGTSLGTIAATATAVGGAINLIKTKIAVWKLKNRDVLKNKKQENRKRKHEKVKDKESKRRGRGVKSKQFVKNVSDQDRMVGDRMVELHEKGKESGNAKLWMMYYIVAKTEGSDDEEAEALADLLVEEENA